MKPYVKPELIFESFELSQSIAACGWDMNQSDKKSCEALGDEEWGHFPVKLFTDSTRCEVTEDKTEGYCYEVSSGEMGLFNS